MALKIGDVIVESKYLILEVIGEGRFGNVYRAHDQFLDVDVAIKELKREELADELYEEFVDRFKREARIGRALRHDNIVHVSTLERVGDDYYLVMDYVDGPSLAQRLGDEGTLHIEEAVDIAIQLCDGLAVVHDHSLGIVHRDIKPSNILLTSKGQPRIADFGLAQLAGESLRSLGLGKGHPGTPLYISPEQGTTIDYLRPASDIYSLGCVLFEMLTGKTYKRVEGTRASEWRPQVPGWLGEVLGKMLEGDWGSRYQEAELLGSDLSDGLTGELETKAELSSLLKRAEEALAAQDWAQAIRLCEEGLELRPGHARLGSLLAQAKNGEAQEAERRRDEEQEQRRRERRATAEARKTETKLPALFGGLGKAAIIGVSVIACVVGLWWASRQFGRPAAPSGESPTPTATAPGTHAPTPTATPPATVAPASSESVYVVRHGDTISLIANQFGVTLESIMSANGLTDYLLYVGQELIIPLDSATPTSTAVVEATMQQDRTTYVVQTGDTMRSIAERFEVTVEQLMEANYIIDPDSLREAQVLVIPAAPSRPATPLGGARIAFQSQRDGPFEIYIMNPDGSQVDRLTNNAAFDENPCWSPDGTRIAFASDRNGNHDIYAMNWDGSAVVNLTNNAADDVEPSWSSDGRRIAFVSKRDGNEEIYVMNLDDGEVTRLTNNVRWDRDPSWSPDGTRIAFESFQNGTNWEIYVTEVDDGSVTRLTDNTATDLDPTWSPDGARIAYTSCQEGGCSRGGIYVMNADGSGVARLIQNTELGSQPSWSPDAMQLAFICWRNGGGDVCVMSTDGGDPVNITKDGAWNFSPSWSPH